MRAHVQKIVTKYKAEQRDRSLINYSEVKNHTMSRDQAIGWLIFIVCVVFIVGYIVALFGYEQVIQPILNLGPTSHIQFWLIAIPVLVAFVAILAIGAWIGWTMGTTPPPRPIEDFETETTTE
jgi:TRAP-type C4-dicarboxylate transport system permease small subunit